MRYKTRSEYDAAVRRSIKRFVKSLIVLITIIIGTIWADGFWNGIPEDAQETCLEHHDINLRCDELPERPIIITPYVPGPYDAKYVPEPDIEVFHGQPVDEPSSILLIALAVWILVYYVEFKNDRN